MMLKMTLIQRVTIMNMNIKWNIIKIAKSCFF